MKKLINIWRLPLIIALVGSLLVGCGTKEMTNFEEPSNKENTENSLSIFDIQDGRLVRYSGEETEVSLPETVTEITSTAFRERKALIESVTIGKNVTYIAEDAFEGMADLAAVYVEEGNAHYSSSGDFLASKDGSTLFLFGTNTFNTAIFDYADTIAAQKFCENGFKIVFHDAVLHFSAPTDEENLTSNCALEKIEAFGNIIELHTNFKGDHAVAIQYLSDIVLVTDYTYGVGDTYIISKDGIWEQHTDENLSADNCNDPIISISIDTDGKLVFTCRPRKYVFTGGLGDLLVYSSGRDEVYSVEGTIYFDGKRPQYTVEHESVLSEKYTESQLKEEFDAMNSFYEQYDPLGKYETIDELFDKNKAKYGEFEFMG